MVWIFLAIFSHFLWAWTNIGDKYILSHKIKNPYIYLMWLGFFGVTSLLFIPFINFYIPAQNTLLLILIAGILYFYGGMPYVKAMQMEEPTRINIWWNLIPIFSLLIGWTFFGERFEIIQLAAFAFLVLGAFIGSAHAKGRRIVFSPAVLLMMIAAICFALYGVLFHRITQEISFILGFVWVHLIMALCALTLFFAKKIRQDFWQTIKNVDGKFGTLLVAVGLSDHGGIFFNQWALSMGSAALVFAMEGFQVLFVFIIASFFTIFAPRIIKEELDRKNVLLKVVAMILMIVGVVVLSLNS